MSKLRQVRDAILTAGEELAPFVKDKDTDGMVSPVLNLRRAIRKAKSTSGVTMGGREMELSVTKLDECVMWADRGGWKTAQERLHECLMWAAVGVSDEKAEVRN